MDDLAISTFVADLLIVLTAGFLSGIACKRLGVSLLLGYLVVGAVIGEGGLGFVSQENHELEYLARAGALFLLFAVGIEFSLEVLFRLSRFFFVGGVVQMVLVAAPLALVCRACGMSWPASFLAATAGALSSTVLVFKALTEWGQTATPHGRRAIGILLFQDVALVPLMLLIPLLTGRGDAPTFNRYLLLFGSSVVFVAAVLSLRLLIGRWLVPLLAKLRSVEIVVLFTLSVLGGVCWGSYAIGLPPAIGALAAGLMLSGNRLSKQIDTLVLPYRESFAAVFFVTLGTLLQPSTFIDEPILLGAGLIGMLLLKALAATLALRLTRLPWPAAFGMGLGLAQLGEFSFMLIAQGVSHGVISGVDYNRMLFMAIGTLIVTPLLLKAGLQWKGRVKPDEPDHSTFIKEPVQHAIVIGIGLIGRQIASRLESMGVDVCLVDLSPINLHAFAQAGFRTVSGDARDHDVLRRADAAHCRLAVVSVPDDMAARQIVRALRELNSSSPVIVRCRYQAHIGATKRAGATAVVSEEEEASGALLNFCERIVRLADEDADAARPQTESTPQRPS